MIQTLPRYCPRCSAPTRPDLQSCAVCDLSVQAFLQWTDSQSTAPTDSPEPAFLDALAPTPRRFQPLDEDVLPVLLPASDAPALSDPLPRFPPASPLPLPAVPPHSLALPAPPAPSSASQELCLLPASPVFTEELSLDATLPASSDPSLPIEETSLDAALPASLVLPAAVLPDCAETRQSEGSEYSDTAFQITSAPTPRLFQQEDEKSLSYAQHCCDVTDEVIYPSRVPPASPLLSEPGKRNGRGNQWRTGVIVTLLATLLIFASGGYLIFSTYLSNWNHSQAIFRTTHVNKTINAQATAAVKMANTNPYVSGGKLIFADTLQVAHSNWDQNTDCAFKDGSYHVTAMTIQSCTLNANVTLTNFVLEVKATLLQGNLGGFFFRENKLHDKSNAYLLDFDSKGGYQLWNYSVSDPAQLIDYGTSSSFRNGYNQANVIALVVQGSNMTLYVNGQMVKRFIDSTYNSGGLSLISSEYAPYTGISEVAYSNLRLWQL